MDSTATIRKEFPGVYFVAGVGWCGPQWEAATARDVKPCVGCGTNVPVGALYCSPCSRENLSAWMKAHPDLKRGRGL